MRLCRCNGLKNREVVVKRDLDCCSSYWCHFLARQPAFPLLISSHTLTSPCSLGHHLIAGMWGAAPLLMHNFTAKFIGAQKVMPHPSPHFTMARLARELYEKEVHSTYTCEQMFASLLGTVQQCAQFSDVEQTVIVEQTALWRQKQK